LAINNCGSVPQHNTSARVVLVGVRSISLADRMSNKPRGLDKISVKDIMKPTVCDAMGERHLLAFLRYVNSENDNAPLKRTTNEID